MFWKNCIKVFLQMHVCNFFFFFFFGILELKIVAVDLSFLTFIFVFRIVSFKRKRLIHSSMGDVSFFVVILYPP